MIKNGFFKDILCFLFLFIILLWERILAVEVKCSCRILEGVLVLQGCEGDAEGDGLVAKLSVLLGLPTGGLWK